MAGRPRVYLAGPEVFLPDAAAMARRKCALAARIGLEGVFPADAAAGLSPGASPGRAQRARAIFAANEALIRSCDGLIANLTPFRGASADAGTVYELGFMRALGRPVAGYSNVAADYAERVAGLRRRGSAAGDADRPDMAVEDFGLADNLMIAAAIEDCGGVLVRTAAPAGQEMTDLAGFEACLGQIARLIGRRPGG
ncbi:MAG: nucleoside 2-deoxyribosyltransferase [Hyphomicrobiaceae bacterium]